MTFSRPTPFDVARTESLTKDDQPLFLTVKGLLFTFAVFVEVFLLLACGVRNFPSRNILLN